MNPTRNEFKIKSSDVVVPLDLFNKDRIQLESLDQSQPVVLDLFSGAGGLSLGFKAAGFRVAGACELDEWACDTIRYNFPEEKILSGDIQKISGSEFKEMFGKVDVVIGGPPCQGFSIANGKKYKVDDPRNTLFKEYLRAVEALSPSVILIENVVGLKNKKTIDGKLYLDIIMSELELLGYHVQVKVLHAQDFGVPQIRPRLFIMGSKNGLFPEYPMPTHFAAQDIDNLFSSQCNNHIPLWAAISDLPIINAREGEEVMAYTKNPETSIQKLLRGDATTLYNHRAMMHSSRLVSRFSQVPWGGSGSDVTGEYGARKRNSMDEGKKYDQNNRRNFPNKPSHTIPASFYANFVHPFENRNYTPREGARLQTFPDWYRFMGKPTVVSQKLLAKEGRSGEMHLCQYNQIGNAVPPLLAYNIALEIKKVF